MSNPTPGLPSPQQRNIIQSTILRVRLVWRLIRDPRVLWLLKLIPVGGLLYVFFPLDLITDLIPVIGLTDDAGIILGSLWLFVEMCPPDVVKEHMDDLTAINVKGTWKEPEQQKLPGGSGESESTKDTKQI
ncbi:MAG: DUF1232 domain-containing protein [Anaerolineales bacterium]